MQKTTIHSWQTRLKQGSICLLFALTLPGCCSPKKDPIALPGADMSNFSAETAISPIRLQALRDASVGFGAQSGLAWQAGKIDELLNREENTLNRIFSFRQLLLKDNVLPPVLMEGHNNLNLADNRTIRLADRIYKINQPPRFVTAAPTWRDYLWMNYPPPPPPDASLLPKNWRERKVWNDCVKRGWQEGVDQANQIFAINVGRLKRDFAGMILYRQLLAQNIVTPPYVSRLNLGVTGDANSLRIDDQVLRISAISQLNGNTKTWRPIIVQPDKNP